MDNNNAMSELVKGVDYLVRQSFNSAPFDRTFIGIIKGIQGDTYTVQINDVEYKNIKSLQSGLSVYDIVKVVVPQNNMNNMFILGNSVSGGGGTSNGLTASFINNVYSLNGKVNGADTTLNLLKNGTLSSGTFSGTLHDSIKVDGSNVTNRAALFDSQITANPNFNGSLFLPSQIAKINMGTENSVSNPEIWFHSSNRYTDASHNGVWIGYANSNGTFWIYDHYHQKAMLQNTAEGTTTFYGNFSGGSVGGTTGTFSGEVKTSSFFVSNRADIGFTHKHSTSGTQISFGVGSSGTNRGIYDDAEGGWMIYRGAYGKQTIINGGIRTTGAIIPHTDGEYNLGGSSNRWNVLCTNALWLFRATSYHFAFSGTPTANRTITFQNASGTVAFTSSDARLKENIEDTAKDGLDIINQINIRQFDWKDNDEVGYNKGTHQDIGFVADELEKIDPRFVVNGSGGYNDDGTINPKCIDTFYLVGYLTKAVQELSEEINKIKESGESK